MTQTMTRDEARATVTSDPACGRNPFATEAARFVRATSPEKDRATTGAALERIAAAGTLRLSDTFAAPDPWSTHAREYLTSRVGLDDRGRQWGMRERLTIRIAMERPIQICVGERIERFGDVETRHPVYRTLGPGIVEVGPETALAVLFKTGVGVVENLGPAGEGTSIEVGYRLITENGEAQPWSEPVPEALRARVAAVAKSKAKAA